MQKRKKAAHSCFARSCIGAVFYARLRRASKSPPGYYRGIAKQATNRNAQTAFGTRCVHYTHCALLQVRSLILSWGFRTLRGSLTPSLRALMHIRFWNSLAAQTKSKNTKEKTNTAVIFGWITTLFLALVHNFWQLVEIGVLVFRRKVWENRSQERDSFALCGLHVWVSSMYVHSQVSFIRPSHS